MNTGTDSLPASVLAPRWSLDTSSGPVNSGPAVHGSLTEKTETPRFLSWVTNSRPEEPRAR